MSYIALSAAVFLGVLGQFLLKHGASAPNFYEQIFSISTIIGLLLYGISAFAYMFSLRVLPTSIAYPTAATGYVMAAAVSVFVFGESISLSQVSGVLLICAGVILLHLR